MINRETSPAGAQHCPKKQLHMQAMMRSETVWPSGKNAKLQHCRANTTHVVAHTHTHTHTHMRTNHQPWCMQLYHPCNTPSVGSYSRPGHTAGPPSYLLANGEHCLCCCSSKLAPERLTPQHDAISAIKHQVGHICRKSAMETQVWLLIMQMMQHLANVTTAG
jgi:hypothetical protein